MLKGILKALDDKDMESLHGAALEVLQRTGLQIRGDFLLEALAGAGCRVDFATQRAWFEPDLVERQIEGQRGRYRQVRSSLWYPFCREMPRNDVAFPDEFSIDYGFAAPKIFDYQRGIIRRPTTQDMLDAIHLGNALKEVKAVCSPYICGDFDPRMETIESSRLLLKHTLKPGWVGTSSGKEVKYLAEFAALAAQDDPARLRTGPPAFVHAYCTTSPLKIGSRSCEVLKEALKYKFPVNFASMPILGATAPVTPAGAAVVAIAEILGGLTATTLLDPDCYCYATSISSEMDMRTMQICYATPAAMLTDAILHQLFRWRYDLVLNVEPSYVEAPGPGIQAASLKLFRQIMLGCTASLPLSIGLLDNGSVFSPTQAMIDYDMNTALYRFSRGTRIDAETLAVDLINELEFCEDRTYLDTDHTLSNFRDLMWDTPIFNRTRRQTERYDIQKEDARLLDRAERAWRDLVAAHPPVARPPEFVAELDRIVAAARRELLA